MASTYKVVKGDTLTKIAAKYNTTVANLVKLNDITNPNYIVVGQVLKLSEDSGSTPKPSQVSKATIKYFGLQSNTNRTVYATWTWNQLNTDKYQIIWYYYIEDNDIWFIGSNTSTTDKQCTYNAPNNAAKVRFKVKPIAKTHKVNNKDVAYWTAGWSTEKTYDFDKNPPEAPSAPQVEIKNFNLTAELDNIDVGNATHIQFQVVKDNKTVFKSGKAKINTSFASYSCTVTAGSEYKVRARAYRDGDENYGEWSEYSSSIATIPATPSKITTIRATSETSVYLEWSAVTTAVTYDIEYATKKNYLDGSDQATVESGIQTTHFEKTGLESGEEYFFRVRAVNDEGESSWSEITSVVIGEKPSAPTTWSSTTTVVVGEPLNLYWVHNSQDNSSQTYAQLELTIDGKTTTHEIKNTTDEDEKDKTSVYSINTSSYKEGVQIKWRVKTCGITGEYSDWSVERTVDIYAPPTLEMRVTDSNDDIIENLTGFPIYISAIAGPNTQNPIGYHLSVIANSAYEILDEIGNMKTVTRGQTVYSRYFDVSGQFDGELSAGDLHLENNINYTIKCVVSMNSGLTAEESHDFTVAWDDVLYEPTAEIGIDPDTVSAYIRPYCDQKDVLLSVYRREFDGSFVEIAKDLENEKNIFVTDPHPALDYARYRIVAKDKVTSSISYCDLPGYSVGEIGVIIQWDEAWSNFEASTEEALEEPSWSGSMLRLLYNIDVSDSFKPDTELVEYIGRKNPVAYYGTQIGSTSSWKMDIDKADKETLYALRRLAIWMGNVYVREPSGSGYWASIKVSFSQTHRKLTIPVTLSVTRVEGGV